MNMPGLFFDLLLAMTMVWLAWNALNSRDMFRAVVLFIVFGILSALAWVRLEAPDIALAEAAVGAGLTGVLLLDAVGCLEGRGKKGQSEETLAEKAVMSGNPSERSLSVRFLSVALIAVAGFVMVSIAVRLPDGHGLGLTVEKNMGLSGVSNRVTAVLLNFRGYDTLLEVGVLLLAVTGVLSLRANGPGCYLSIKDQDPILSAFARLAVPVMFLTSGYLLFAGTHSPGGAFQSGAVLGASLVLLRLSGFLQPSWLKTMTNGLLAAGFSVFLITAGGVMLSGASLLEYPAGTAGGLIFLIETALAVSTAFILAELFSSWERGEKS